MFAFSVLANDLTITSGQQETLNEMVQISKVGELASNVTQFFKWQLMNYVSFNFKVITNIGNVFQEDFPFTEVTIVTPGENLVILYRKSLSTTTKTPVSGVYVFHASSTGTMTSRATTLLLLQNNDVIMRIGTNDLLNITRRRYVWCLRARIFEGADVTDPSVIRAASDSVVLQLNRADIITLTTLPPAAALYENVTTSDVTFSGYLLKKLNNLWRIQKLTSTM